MAKNTNNDQDGGILRNVIDDMRNSNKRVNWFTWSIISIVAIMIMSFAIPDKYYHKNLNLLFLNIELLILFSRDIYIYFKRSCKPMRWIMSLMVSIYSINIVDLLFNIPHDEYISISLLFIVAILVIVYIVGLIRK